MSITFLGHLDGLALAEQYEWCDCVVVPSLIENFGMVVVEALSYRRPVIASKGTPWSELEQIGCGLWCGTNPEALAAALRLMRNRDLAAMGAAGRQHVESAYSWRSKAEQMRILYRSLVDDG
jgi:glycosyltransferase involved in cell wall biosynthesis